MSNFDIQFPKNVQADVEAHCFSEVAVEVGGFLVGTLGDNGPIIKGAIPSLKAVSAQTNLTIGHDAWEEAHSKIATDYPDQQIVGWFHSHPGFGIFLSDYDSFIQENFFSDSRQVALVVDPIAGELGWFNFDDGKINELAKSKTHKPKIAKTNESRNEVIDRMLNLDSPVSVKPRAWKILIPAVLVTFIGSAAAWTAGAANGQSKMEKQYQSSIQQVQIDSQRKQFMIESFNAGTLTLDGKGTGYKLVADGSLSWSQIAYIYYSNQNFAASLKSINKAAEDEGAPAENISIWLPFDLNAATEDTKTQSPSPSPSASGSPKQSPSPSASKSSSPSASPSASKTK